MINGWKSKASVVRRGEAVDRNSIAMVQTVTESTLGQDLDVTHGGRFNWEPMWVDIAGKMSKDEHIHMLID